MWRFLLLQIFQSVQTFSGRLAGFSSFLQFSACSFDQICVRHIAFHRFSYRFSYRTYQCLRYHLLFCRVDMLCRLPLGSRLLKIRPFFSWPTVAVPCFHPCIGRKKSCYCRPWYLPQVRLSVQQYPVWFRQRHPLSFQDSR